MKKIWRRADETGKHIHLQDPEKPETANSAEIILITEALRRLNEKCRLSIYTETGQVGVAVESDWIEKWKQNGWKQERRNRMFEKFGLLKSVEELNAAAEGFLKEGDTESLKLLAVENGIDEEDAKDYGDGLTGEFATLATAAIGRLKVIRREKINKENNSQHRQNQTYILEITKGMILEPSVAAGIMKRENIILDTVEALKKHSVQTGTDEDMRNLIRALVTGKAELKKTAEEIVKRYSDKGED